MMAARHTVETPTTAGEDIEHATRLHDELARLPEAFREPLVLCYLEGFTQEQAAQLLRCPLGTVQSRLARGRARLKARLERRGIDLSAGFTGMPFGSLQHTPAPIAWAEPTVRLALEFAGTGSPAIAGSAAAVLAEEVLRAMVRAKLTGAAVTMLFGALVLSGAATWAIVERNRPAAAMDRKIASPKQQPGPQQPQEVAPAPGQRVARTIRGTVRDQQGRPVAKAWIGNDVRRSYDTWELVHDLEAGNRIRERKEPFRDQQGHAVPAGIAGKYFELRDQNGKWNPVHPLNVRRYEKPEESPFGSPELDPEVTAVLARGCRCSRSERRPDTWKCGL